MSAYSFGGRRSTVARRFRMKFSLPRFPHASRTASASATMKSSRLSLNSSGENSYAQESYNPASFSMAAIIPVPSTAMRINSSSVFRNTNFRCSSLVAIYECTTARRTPRMDSTVRRISGSFADIVRDVSAVNQPPDKFIFRI